MTTASDIPPRPSDLITRAFICAAAATALAGAVLAFGLQPTTDLTDDFWRYPWSSSGAFVAFSLLSAALHGAVAAGLATFGRSGAAGRTRTARVGVALAVTGTVLLAVGELASIPVRDAKVDEAGAVIVGTLFGIASLSSTFGFVLAGIATLRARIWHGWHRYAPIATGVWLVVLTPVSLAAPTLLHGGVGVYGLCLLGVAIALRTETAPDPRPTIAAATAQRVEPGVGHA